MYETFLLVILQIRHAIYTYPTHTLKCHVFTLAYQQDANIVISHRSQNPVINMCVRLWDRALEAPLLSRDLLMFGVTLLLKLILKRLPRDSIS